MLAVIDTNILVSGLWTPAGKASEIISNIIAGRIRACTDHRIMEEYRNVLLRPKFCFNEHQVNALLDLIAAEGMSVVPETVHGVDFPDEFDRPFYEVALFCNAPLVTGNLKHFPEDPRVMSLTEFCGRYL